ncbi:hypothetical protein [Pseudoduganella umbonata]|uniref:Uncharacterized protein n=1 Tax=Pseudoduganella umbonata TaxID=864828 RepID=A0A4P8HXR2_9BURK|nr:hypothetical protein [Pseudoduganella umbonata]MBB3224483.1 hypothetical protein [Pseudoduganella umbonata]QCP13255.1 hypothetical protein FCL38_24610 [Pseudoduganella umbonata]
MQHIREESRSITFTRANPEEVFLIGSEHLSFLSDVRLSFWCISTFPTPQVQTSAIADLRVYFNGKDISRDLAGAIAKALDFLAGSRAQYEKAMNRWISILEHESAIIGLSRSMIDEQKRLASEFVKKDWREFFLTLRTEGFGYRGALHPLHFLFREISIPPLSLRDILYPESADDDYPLNSIDDIRLVFANGPSRIYQAGYMPIALQYEGYMYCKVKCVLDDSWEKEMSQRLTDLSLQVANISDQMLELKSTYQEFELRAAEFKSIADGIEAALNESSPR